MEGYLIWVLIICVALGLLLDSLLPLRALQQQRRHRWTTNAILYLSGGLLTRLLLPGGSLVVAYWAERHGVGLLHVLALPDWVALVAGVLLLDLGIYWIHRLSHRLSWLWRLHRTHHTDVDVDVTTEFRHHPLENLMDLCLVMGLVLVLGVGVEAVLLRLLLVIPVSLFSHSNWLWPQGLDRVLRWVIITPAMHRIHHSAWQPETDSNYGTLLSWWDRLFGSYCDVPRDSYRDMQLGLAQYREADDQWLGGILLNPLRSKK